MDVLVEGEDAGYGGGFGGHGGLGCGDSLARWFVLSWIAEGRGICVGQSRCRSYLIFGLSGASISVSERIPLRHSFR